MTENIGNTFRIEKINELVVNEGAVGLRISTLANLDNKSIRNVVDVTYEDVINGFGVSILDLPIIDKLGMQLNETGDLVTNDEIFTGKQVAQYEKGNNLDTYVLTELLNSLMVTKDINQTEIRLMNKICQVLLNNTLTVMEAKVMQYLLADGYYAEKWFSDLTASDIAIETGIPISQLRGVLSSLYQKNYLWNDVIEEVKEPIVYATDKGYQLSDEYEVRWEPENKFM